MEIDLEQIYEIIANRLIDENLCKIDKQELISFMRDSVNDSEL